MWQGCEEHMRWMSAHMGWMGSGGSSGSRCCSSSSGRRLAQTDHRTRSRRGVTGDDPEASLRTGEIDWEEFDRRLTDLRKWDRPRNRCSALRIGRKRVPNEERPLADVRCRIPRPIPELSTRLERLDCRQMSCAFPCHAGCPVEGDASRHWDWQGGAATGPHARRSAAAVSPGIVEPSVGLASASADDRYSRRRDGVVEQAG
jgi:hypothetical protein